MENNMVEDLIDNEFPIDNEKALNLIKDFFKYEFPEFELIKFFNNENYNGFGIKYRSKTIEINFFSPKGGLEYEIFIDGNQYSLFSYEERLRQVYICSEKNLKFVLSVISIRTGYTRRSDLSLETGSFSKFECKFSGPG